MRFWGSKPLATTFPPKLVQVTASVVKEHAFSFLGIALFSWLNMEGFQIGNSYIFHDLQDYLQFLFG